MKMKAFSQKNSLLLELGVSFFYCRCVLLVVGGHVSLHLSPNIAGCCPPWCWWVLVFASCAFLSLCLNLFTRHLCSISWPFVCFALCLAGFVAFWPLSSSCSFGLQLCWCRSTLVWGHRHLFFEPLWFSSPLWVLAPIVPWHVSSVCPYRLSWDWVSGIGYVFVAFTSCSLSVTCLLIVTCLLVSLLNMRI